ncbi:MAG: hypothetical protein V1760_01495 [Candidatus Peregrinibacteria bacterium]
MLKKLVLALGFMAMLTLACAPMTRAEAVDTPSSNMQDPYFMFDLRGLTHEDVDEERWVSGGINYIFERAVSIMALTVGAAAVLMITVGGFMVLASGGRQQWVDTGKSFIFKSLIGLSVTLGAYIIVQTVQLLIRSVYG